MPSPPSPLDEITAGQAALGYAISKWADVEAALLCLYSICTTVAYWQGEGFMSNTRASIAFYAVENFRTKLQMTDAVIRDEIETLDEPSAEVVRACWGKIHSRAGKLAKRRNQLAHGNVLYLTNYAPGRRTRLVPSVHNPKFREFTRGPRHGLTTRDMQRIGAAFEQFAWTIMPLAQFLGAHPKLLRRHVERALNLMENIGRSDPSALARLKLGLSWPQ